MGGTVTGLTGIVLLQDSAGDDLSLSASGPFTFRTAIASGGRYAVTVLTQPAGQTCSVANGAGNEYLGTIWRIEKRSLGSGALLPALGTSGVVRAGSGGYGNRPYGLATDGPSLFAVGCRSVAGNSLLAIERRSSVDGALVPAFGHAEWHISSSGWRPRWEVNRSTSVVTR